MLKEMVVVSGLSHRLAAIRTIDQAGDAIAHDSASALDRLIEACTASVNESQADPVILGGAGLCGLADAMQGEVPVPVLCSVEAGVRAVLAAGNRDGGVRIQRRG
jgi:Asp/Glu/hydantoin racemase